MSRYLLRRLIGIIPLLLGISFVVYALLNLVPGSPTDQFEFNPNIRPEDRERIEENLGLNAPWYARYFTWLANVLQGDLGNSFTNFAPVENAITAALPNTLILSVTALIFALVLSVPIGIISAVRLNSFFDRFVTMVSTAFFSIPSIWLGLLLIILFSVKFQEWGMPFSLPTGGVRDLRGESGFWDRVEHLILPAFTLGVVQLAGWTRYVRSSMLEVIRQDYIRTAEAKGLRQRAVLMGHAFRNAMLPLVTLVGLTIPDLFGGALIVENVFAYPGIGRLTVESLNQNDYSVAMAAIMMLAFLTVLGNLIADVMYGVLDPRVRFD
ncbi:MAG TPA: ABC transporter permease [Thermomicrobiales bacterium]|nr:ABC transporter permease [Thermomicrobiales bacterium]